MKRVTRSSALKWSTCFLLISLTILAASYSGYKKLEDWNGPGGSLTTDLYIPALVFAQRGEYTQLDVNKTPGLRSFLNIETQAFSLDENVPLHLAPLQAYDYYHRYLVLTTGLTWRIFGVTWNVMRAYTIGLLVLSALAVFFLNRLLLNPWLSFLGALLFSFAPFVLLDLHCTRDFAKIPFFLWTFYTFGLAIKYRPKGWKGLLLAISSGMLIGIGLGFRRDLMVAVPAAFLLFLWMPRTAFLSWRRILAPIAFSFTFLLFSAPILLSFWQYGTLGHHDTLMGFSTYNDRELNMQPGSYEKIYRLNDLFVSFSAFDYRERARLIENPRCTMATPREPPKKAYLMETVFSFPADVLARAYTATLRVLQNDGGYLTHNKTTIPPATNLLYGLLPLLFSLSGILFLFRRYGFRTFSIVLLLAYFSAICSIQFAPRHIGHTTFVMPLLTLFSCSCIAEYIWTRWKQQIPINHPGFSWPSVLVGLLIILLPAVGLLAVARAWQGKQVTHIRQAYETAPIKKIQTKTVNFSDKTFFLIPAEEKTHPKRYHHWVDNLSTHLYCASFQYSHDMDFFWLYFENYLLGEMEWVQTAMAPPGTPDGSIVDVYFPVYETHDEMGGCFQGVALPNVRADKFLGLREITNFDSFGILPLLKIPRSPESFRSHQRISLSPFAETNYAPDAFRWLTGSYASASSGYDTKQTGWTEWLKLAPWSQGGRRFLAKFYTERGQLTEAWRVLEEGLRWLYNDYGYCRIVSTFWERHKENEPALPAFPQLAEQYPQSAFILTEAGIAQKHAGNKEDARRLLGQALHADAPLQIKEVAFRHYQRLASPEDTEKQAWKLLETYPDSLEARCKLLENYFKHLSKEDIDTLIKEGIPYHYDSYIFRNTCFNTRINEITKDTKGIPSFAHFILGEAPYPENWPHLLELGHCDYFWEKFIYPGRLCQARGQYEKALCWYQRGLAVEPQRQDAFNALPWVYVGQNSAAKLLPEWRAIAEKHPDWILAHYALANTYERLTKYDDALKVYSAALQLNPENEAIQKRISRIQNAIARKQQ